MRAVLVGLLLLLCASPLWAGSILHVSPAGDNTQGQGTAAKPWKTIAHAALKAKPGDTVLIGPGRFSERLTLARKGTYFHPVTYKGTRGAKGEYETILDGCTAVEANWQDAGNGVYKAQLGYDPKAMRRSGYAIWRCGDHAMESGKCQEVMAYGPTMRCRRTTGGPIKYWDGIDALFGYQDGWTYLRFRHREHPRDMQVRAAPAGGVVDDHWPWDRGGARENCGGTVRRPGGRWGAWRGRFRTPTSVTANGVVLLDDGVTARSSGGTC